MKSFLSIREASEYLNLEYKTVYRLVRAGEIPAARLGGVYRIKLTDLESYFEQQKQRVLSRNDGEQGALLSSTPNMHCGRCLKVIRTPEQVAGKCSSPGCTESLCHECWDNDKIRFCSRHEPTWEDNLRSAQKDHAAGRAPRPLSAEETRQMETAYFGRFDRKIREQKAICDPNGKSMAVRNWDTARKVGDETSQLKQLILQYGLPESVIAKMPSNRTDTFVIAESSARKEGLRIGARYHAHLEELLRAGMDTRPVELSELLDLLHGCVRTAEDTDSVYVCAFVSPTGWTSSAVAYIGGGDRMRVFQHRLVLPFLVDLAEGKVYRDRLDARLRSYDALLSPQLRHEQVEEARRYAEDRVLSTRRSLAASDVTKALNMPAEIVAEALKQMASDDRFTVVTINGLGQAVGLKD